MTRVLVLSNLWPPFPGGAERLIFNVARHLTRSMHVEALTGYEQAQRFDGPTIWQEDIPADGEGERIIRAYIADVRPDVIVTHHYYASVFAELLAGCGIPIVQIVLNGQRYPWAAHAVYISEWVRDQLGDARPGDQVMTPPAFADVIADTHGDSIGFIKPLPHKGVDLVYRIAKAMPGRRFLILRGEWQDLETIRHLRNVRFVEPVEDMRDFYRQVRLMLAPSTSEDAGTVAQEATLNGLPCIASAVGGLAETGAGGVLLQPGDLDGWVATIRALDDPTVYERVVERQHRFLASYDHAGRLDALAARIEELAG